MNPAPEQTSELADLGEAVLQAFTFISEHVAEQLGERRPARADPLLNERARANLSTILVENRAALRSLKREPAVARLEIEWLDTKKTECLYVCRASSAGVHPAGLDGRLVSYRAAMGRLAEIPAGHEEELFLSRGRRRAIVRCRLLLHPVTRDGGWDSMDNIFELLKRVVGVDSIRRLIEHVRRSGISARDAAVDYLEQIFAEDEAQQIFHHEQRRKTVYRMELRDQPVLDQYQGSVFRLPLDHQVILLGPPGTGKTTTLIRRLAQKRTEEALSIDEIERLERSDLKREFMSDTGWVMFSPTELLKLYLREAFNREGVPASAWNLRTWNAERITLGRDVLRFLKSGASGKFTLSDSDSPLLDHGSPALAALYEDFSAVVDREVLSKTINAIEWMESADDTEAQTIAQHIRSRFKTGPLSIRTLHDFAEQNDVLRSALSNLDQAIGKEQREIANSLLAPNADQRLQELHMILRDDSSLAGEADGEDEDEAEDDAVDISHSEWDRAATAKALLTVVRSLALETASGRTRSGRGVLTRVSPWIGTRQPDPYRLRQLGRKVQLRRKLRIIDTAARQLVFDVPNAYSRFRRRQIGSGAHYSPQAGATAHSSRISPFEADVIILAMLINARRSYKLFPRAPWLEPIVGRYFMQVLVDEVTDFSSLQLACMLALTHPKLHAWFACGDFRQRITGSGITGLPELDWIGRVAQAPNLETREITSDYRQSDRLKELAQVLIGEGGVATDGPSACPADHAPLLLEGASESAAAEWLAHRIVEVERIVGRLPSIAVFVDSEDTIDRIVKSTAPFLAEHNIQIVGCRDGRDVGNAQEVRVFDIKHIKGLEFEAVFFLGVDALAARLPILFDRYIYVGVTRAATFLGITSQGALPTKLEPIRHLLSGGRWE